MLSIQPDAAEVHKALGDVLVGQGNLVRAQAHFEQAVGLQPDFLLAYDNLAALLWKQGKLEQALVRYEQVATLAPGSADAHNNVANILAALGRLDAAALRFVQALALNPDLAEAHNNLGNVLRAWNKLTEAELQYRRAVDLKPSYVDAYNNLGNVLREQGRIDEALAHFQTALTLDPKYAEGYRNIARVLTEQGKIDQAISQCDRALALDPNSTETYLQRADLKTFSPGDPDLATLETLLTRPEIGQAQQLRLRFVLGKALEEVGQYDRAFEHWLAGNALKRSQIDYDETGEEYRSQRSRQLINSDLLKRFGEAGDGSPTPIFIVGMPCSGTTLVEQILSSHPWVHGAGELTHLWHLVCGVRDAELRLIPFPEFLADPPAAGLRGLGRAYLAQLPPLPAGKSRITDKMPGNFRCVGLIRLILPRARSSTSCAIRSTPASPASRSCLRWARRSATTWPNWACAYRRYHELMDHWRSVLPPGVMLDVRYEEVVENLPEQARRMLEFCDLPWNDACLDFHQNDRPVRTASKLQVRRPLYRSAVGRWRRYEAHLAPLMAELAGLGEPR